MTRLVTLRLIVGFAYGIFLCNIGYSIFTWQYWVIVGFTTTLILLQ